MARWCNRSRAFQRRWNYSRRVINWTPEQREQALESMQFNMRETTQRLENQLIIIRMDIQAELHRVPLSRPIERHNVRRRLHELDLCMEDLLPISEEMS